MFEFPPVITFLKIAVDMVIFGGLGNHRKSRPTKKYMKFCPKVLSRPSSERPKISGSERYAYRPQSRAIDSSDTHTHTLMGVYTHTHTRFHRQTDSRHFIRIFDISILATP